MADLIKSELRLDTDDRVYQDYKNCIRDLIEDEAVQSMKGYLHHNNVTCLDHSLHVSYKSYLICRYLKIDYESAARGGLLHDFFLYDWRKAKPRNGLHGYTHPGVALANANKRFKLNTVEKDIIIKHMWPLTIALPKYKESYVVALVDMYCALIEVINGDRSKQFTDLYEF